MNLCSMDNLQVYNTVDVDYLPDKSIDRGFYNETQTVIGV